MNKKLLQRIPRLNNQPLQLILFDCDGTLTDSHGAIAQAMQKAFTDHGLTKPDYQDVLGIIGLSLVAAVEQLADDDLDNDLKTKLCESYGSNYRAMESSLALYPNVIETLEELDNRGYAMGVVTGKSSRGLIRVMDTFDLHRFFPVWRTADICTSKPHPAMVLECMHEMGALPEHTSVIGDSRFDIQMANAANVRSYGVSFGVEPAHILKTEGALHVFDQFEDILEKYPSLFSASLV
ncbi:HAD family hydrolase [Ghiorsea bivora]|uniref:HAD family hydrolase n=1 Tax=Ghiorsea bivora TaxID=1485545 RepID=UPI001E596A44|nr:HAD-IA family hydrolase [Ghiorsea bivora]